jgi:hypothetical protein
MPVILTTSAEVETWMTGSSDEALKLQRPFLDGTLKIVARGVKEDPAFAGLSGMNTFVSDPDREARANSVKNAVAICRMEGGEPSECCLEQLALFEAGHISATEMRDRVVRHRRKDARTDDHSSDSRMIGERAVKPAYPPSECSRKKRSISLVASGPRASV